MKIIRPISRCAILPLLAAVLMATGCAASPKHSAYRPIHEYARNGDLANVTLDLSQNPKDLNLPDDASLTPLHLAVSHCHTNVVGFLLERGADANAKAKDGATPLHLAAQEGCLDGIKLLLANGAKMNARDDNGRTPLGRAKEWQQNAAVNFLETAGGSE